MARCGTCGGGERAVDRRVSADQPYVDSTQAMFAGSTPRYTVLQHAGDNGRGKTFSTLSAAEEYARTIHGIIRPE